MAPADGRQFLRGVWGGGRARDAAEREEAWRWWRELRVTEPYACDVVQEEEKNKIQNDLRILTERLSRINESLARKVRAHRMSDRRRCVDSSCLGSCAPLWR